MIKKLIFKKKQDGRLSSIEISLSKKELEYLEIDLVSPEIKFEYQQKKIIIKKGNLETEIQEYKNGTLIKLLKNSKILINKAKAYKTFKIRIPFSVIVDMNLTEKDNEIKMILQNKKIIIKKIENKKSVEGDDNKMGEIITIKVNKGGIGKTFITLQIGSYLALEKNKKILILTSDSQNNIIDYSLKEEIFFEKGLKEFVKGGEGEIIRLRKNLDFIPTESSTFGSHFLMNLPNFLLEMKNKYDYILIDSIPTMKIDSVFVKCSDKIIIPCFSDNVTIKGVINVVNEAGSDKVLAIIMNKYENKKIQKNLLSELKEVVNDTDILFPNPIKSLSEIEELLHKGKTIWESNSIKLRETKEIFRVVGEAIINKNYKKEQIKDEFDISF
ncbi:ParA family protein [Cetobacterium sp. 2A]|uniref:ParA family protein n=1 Tax=Cetobacterium sp. 2A TaxID=2754723 RepID=UPI00163B7CAD|nr:ParA family protein [Cetobacterium sp. 2A]MBC2856988.1 ParA family protein [Cetobacterium sp. 2A]